jgi:2-amino-4-hydroxy-6-hydroxymethyldihydropteridine diphosphokinase
LFANQSSIAYIGLGANLGDAAGSVQQALHALGSLPNSKLLRQSSLYRSAPFEADGADYINAVAALETGLAPFELLAALQKIEHAFGRERPYFHAPRTLDLDILMYGDLCLNTPTLTLPHAGLTLRAFALAPLLEIAPDLIIPAAGPARQFMTALQDQPAQQIQRLS